MTPKPFNIPAKNYNGLDCGTQHNIFYMLNVIHAEYRYPEYYHAEYHPVGYCSAEWHYASAECLSAEFCHPEYSHAESHNAECHFESPILLLSLY
jgi:hypothetical protein